MSSSSTPEPPAAAPRRRGDRGGRAGGRARARARARQRPRAARRERGRRLGDVRSGRCPGFVWLGFFLVAPLVFIVLVSFWTRTDTGFDKVWTLAQLRRAAAPVQPEQRLLGEHAAVVRDVGDRRRRLPRLRLPGRLLPGDEGREAPEPDRALHHRAGAVLDELPHPLGRLGLSADGPRGSAEPDPDRHRRLQHRPPAARHAVLAPVGAAGDDPALHPVHGHADLLPARAGRPARDRGGARPRRQLVQHLPRGDPAADDARAS